MVIVVRVFQVESTQKWCIAPFSLPQDVVLASVRRCLQKGIIDSWIKVHHSLQAMMGFYIEQGAEFDSLIGLVHLNYSMIL